MIEVWTDDEKIGEASLEGGKLKTSGDIQSFIDFFRWGWGTHKDLTDEEVYHSLPFRLRDRTFVKFKGGEKLDDHKAAWEKLNKEQDAAMDAYRIARWGDDGKGASKEEAPKPRAGLLAE